MSELGNNPALAAQRALFDAGLELAGVRLQRFAENLLAAADKLPGTPSAEIAREAVRHVDGGAVALVAEEPELRDRQLPRPAMSVSAAAEAVLDALAHDLVEAHRRRRG